MSECNLYACTTLLYPPPPSRVQSDATICIVTDIRFRAEIRYKAKVIGKRNIPISFDILFISPI